MNEQHRGTLKGFCLEVWPLPRCGGVGNVGLLLWLLCLNIQNKHCKAKLVRADIGEGGKLADGGVFFL